MERLIKLNLPPRQTLRIAAIIIMLMGLVAGVPAASKLLAAQPNAPQSANSDPLIVTLPPNAVVEVSVNGFCLDRGFPFPGSRLSLIGLAPDPVRSSIAYAMDKNYVRTDLYGTQLAVWSFSTGPNPASYFRNAKDRTVQDDIIAGAKATPVPALTSGDAIPLLDAVSKGLVLASINDYVNISGRDNFYGRGTLQITNLTDKVQRVSVAYGLRFKDARTANTQDVAIIPLGSINVTETKPVEVVGATGAQGPAGPAGPAGPSGPAGAPGAVGAKGDTGPAGATGPIGPAGPAGAPGAVGAKGDTGPAGATGPMGPAGPAGAPGANGKDGMSCWDKNGNGIFDKATEDANGDGIADARDCAGAQGPAGAAGLPGATGPKGDVGPAGAAGPIGPAGLPGATGPKGDKGDAGPAGVAGPIGPAGLPGATGPKGDKGDAGLSGPAGLPGATGPAGLSCWDRNGNGIFDKGEDSNADTLADYRDCMGPQGLPGPAGLAGAKGDKGDPGPAGAAGPAGPVGLPGATGLKGDKGDPGPAGAVGPMGAAGPAGLPGLPGLPGAKGDKGDPGPVGATGPMGPAGPAGLPGAKGDPGPVGATGLMGPAGPAGLPGATGDTGPQGPMGPSGPAGLPGATGSRGPAGLSCWDKNGNGIFEASEDANSDGIADYRDCMGAQGLPGAAGLPGLPGVKGDTGPIGLSGPAGPTGPTGLPGATGPKGDKGDTGPAGPIGLTGAAGPKGDTGSQGPIGLSGPAGPSGRNATFSIVRVSNSTPTDTTETKNIAAVCPVGKTLVGGGFEVDSAKVKNPNIVPEDNFPSAPGTWSVKASVKSCDCDPYPWKLTAWAICIDTPEGGVGVSQSGDNNQSSTTNSFTSGAADDFFSPSN